MILLADGGSTSCDWLAFTLNDSQSVQKMTTIGINPSYSSAESIIEIINQCEALKNIQALVSELHFFGAGCNSDKYATILATIFSEFFPNLRKCIVKSDIHGAVMACTSQPGVVAIMGTGSSICYYDSKNIHMPLPSLGYSIMDDGSGSALGRTLLRSYFYNLMPINLRINFEKTFNLDVSYIKDKLYHNIHPSRFIAHYATFAFENKGDVYMQNMLEENLRSFFLTHLKMFESEIKEVPIHFVGSIAFMSKDLIKKLCEEFNLDLGVIVQSPIDKLYQNFVSFMEE